MPNTAIQEKTTTTRNTGPRPGASPVAWTVGSLSLSILLSSLGTSIANVGLPTLAHTFHASFQSVQWVVIAYLLSITTLIVGAGRLGDLIGRKRLLLAGIAVFTVASLLCGAASGLAMLIAARALQGLGAAIMMALTMAFVAQVVPKARTGSAMGLLATMSAVGTALGPSLGGVLIAGFGWRALFWVNLPLAALTFWLVHRQLPADARKSGASAAQFDYLGAFLLAVVLAAYALAMTLGRNQWGAANDLLLCGAALGLWLFVRTQARATSPLIQLALFRNAALRASLAMNVLVSTVMMATLVVGPFYLARGLGLDAARVGAAMSVGPLISVFGGVVAGRLVDRWGTDRMMRAGLLLMVLGALVLAAVAPVYGVAGYMLGIAVLTPGYQLFQAANNTAVMADVSQERRGLVSGLLTLSRNLGLITGASVMGAVFAAATHATDITEASPLAIAAGLRTTFMVASAAIGLAVAIGWKGTGRNAAARP